ncbi:Lipopolysaccharide-induced tumor necrosis factor-alpha factor -like protein [Channa argus]|uniref:Lipopolysaccharide-induced tumor necrosis factor-alpha factor-like protein n=2 Tax=Channa argus TaxID=215402 RepID=A0A6G1PCL9_CHAAH|nr:Lipopolysaccharide-induced tumor necrosis factor-alpha factor -like protein [Channa argus]
MDPPSYEEASLQQPPSYSTSQSYPLAPPPTYGEAVTTHPDLFPVLTPPTVPTVVISSPQNPGAIVHPSTQIGVIPPVSSRQTPSAVVLTQPPPVPILATCLTNVPGLVRCPRCQQTVISKVTHVPGCAAWWMCVLLSMIGLIFGCCLIPLMIRGLQDTHHTCPQCGNLLHIYKS